MCTINTQIFFTVLRFFFRNKTDKLKISIEVLRYHRTHKSG